MQRPLRQAATLATRTLLPPARQLTSLLLAGLTLIMLQVSPANGAAHSTVAAGGAHSLALAEDGSVWAWGFNDQGQLGDGSLQFSTAPILVHGLPAIKAISAGYTSSIALAQDGSVWTWGSNDSGELGDGTTNARHRPAKIQGLDQVTAIAMSAGTGMAVKADGTLWLWGQSSGTATSATHGTLLAPVPVPSLSGVAGVGIGQTSLFAYTYDCALWAWGKNAFGQLGDGTTSAQPAPSRTNIQACLSGVAANNHTLALSATGDLWAWGYNHDGQLGNGTSRNTSSPALLPLPKNVAAIACDHHSLALRGDGSLWAWGQNDYGQLGDGTVASRTEPLPIKGLSAVTSIAAGAMFSLAAKADGSVWAWGINTYGQLGDGSTDTHTSPVQVTGFEGLGFLNLKHPAGGDVSKTAQEIPPLSFSATPTTGPAPLSVSFLVADDGAPPPVALHWDFGDGEVANSPAPQHIYVSPGNYIVTLTVNYRQEIFRESMKQIVVTPGK